MSNALAILEDIVRTSQSTSHPHQGQTKLGEFSLLSLFETPAAKETDATASTGAAGRSQQSLASALKAYADTAAHH